MVEAVCAQIIPEDQDAGAAKAGVVHFMDTQLTRFYKPLQKTYRRGIAQIDQASIDFAGKPFADLASAQQVAVLHHLSSGDFIAFDWFKECANVTPVPVPPTAILLGSGLLGLVGLRFRRNRG